MFENLRNSLLVCIAVTGLMTTAANAVSVTNRDDREHKITIVEGEVKVDHVLKPQEVLANLCAKGCVLRLNDSDEEEYELDANDVVSIEDGYLYYEEAETAPGATPPATKEQPRK